MNFGLSDGESLEKTNSMVLINDSKETSNSRLINANIGKSLIETTTKSFENMNYRQPSLDMCMFSMQVHQSLFFVKQQFRCCFMVDLINFMEFDIGISYRPFNYQ